MKKLLRLILLLWLLHSVVFLTFDALPEAAYAQLGPGALKKELLEETRLRMGLAGSFWNRYRLSVWHCCHFDLGVSIRSGYPVAELLQKRVLISLPTIICAALVSFIALFAGSWFYSTRHLKQLHRLILAVSPVTILPQFAMASAIATAATLLPGVTGTSGVVVDFLLILAIALMPAGLLLIAAAKTAQDVVGQQFVLVYEAMGLPWNRIRLLVQKNILMQMLPLANRALLALVLGTVFAELSFDRPGIGSVLAEAIRSGDQPMAAGWMLSLGAPTVIFSQIFSKWSRPVHSLRWN